MPTPRYVVPSVGAASFEIPIVSRTHRNKIATIATTGDTLVEALKVALGWSVTYSHATGREYRPEVRGVVVAKIDGSYAWCESRTEGAWKPVKVLA